MLHAATERGKGRKWESVSLALFTRAQSNSAQKHTDSTCFYQVHVCVCVGCGSTCIHPFICFQWMLIGKWRLLKAEWYLTLNKLSNKCHYEGTGSWKRDTLSWVSLHVLVPALRLVTYPQHEFRPVTPPKHLESTYSQTEMELMVVFALGC